MITVKDLSVNVGRKPILDSISLEIPTGKIACIMGINGCGKSTLLNTLMGHPAYKIKGGSIMVGGSDFTKLDADQKNLRGLFMSYQNPSDFPEITGWECLQMIHEAHYNELLELDKLTITYDKELKLLRLTDEMLKRPFNSGFSGGEKKRMEIIQLLICKPSTILLDEIDTGLDVDSMIMVGRALEEYVTKTKATVALVTHYFRFLEYLKPEIVFILEDGKVARTGGYELAQQIDKHGYTLTLN